MSILADRAEVRVEALTFGIPSRTVSWDEVVGAVLLHVRAGAWQVRVLLADGTTRLVGQRSTTRRPEQLVLLCDGINARARGALATVAAEPPGAWVPPVVLCPSLVSRGFGWLVATVLFAVAVLAAAEGVWGAVVAFAAFGLLVAGLTAFLSAPTIAHADGLHVRTRTVGWEHVTGFVPPRGANQPYAVTGRAGMRPLPHATSSPLPSRRRAAWDEVHPRLVWLRDDAVRRARVSG